MLPLLPLSVIGSTFLAGAVEVVLAMVVSFFLITVISSYYRFQHIVELAEEIQPEDMGASAHDILRIQLARFLASCARRNSAFAFALLRLNVSGVRIRLDGPVTAALKENLRRVDVVCVYDDNTLAILAETEADDAEAIMLRVINYLKRNCPELGGQDLRAGISSYPRHALSGKELLRSAEEALEQTSLERLVYMQEIIDVDEEEEAGPEEVDRNNNGAESSVEIVAPDEAEPEVKSGSKPRESGRRRAAKKNAMLDELTGVLKPTAVSAYMQRMMAEIRRKKKAAALFAIGVNNIDHISRIHGEKAANDVLVAISKLLQDNLRTADLIGRHERDAFLVLSEVSLEDAEGIGKRLSVLIQQHIIETGNKKLKTNIVIGVAAYPEHGRNLHHLYRAAQKVLDFNRANDIRAYAVYNPEIHDKIPSKPLKSIKSD
ncbi:MAG: diguanylate cyclase [Kiritimatiellales bacterium]|nr:diguanylate cyclase [Kiritimatiellales bacterium]